MVRNATTDFPMLNIDKAIKAVELFEKNLKGTAQNADAFARVLGYKSAQNGAFINFVADLRKYGLLGKREYISTDLAKKIYLAKTDQKNKYILEAINNVPLFANLIDKIGKDYDSANFEAILVDNGFSGVDALKWQTKIKNLYKKIAPYLTDGLTTKTAIKQDEQNQEFENLGNYGGLTEKGQSNAAPSGNVYVANLPSDGISLKLPKDYSKIKKVRQLLDWLEEEIKEEKLTGSNSNAREE